MPSARDVSVVIDTYNQAAFIEDAVQSVLDQDFKGAVEIIVVDDGSTDDTVARLVQFGDRIRLIRRDNGGQAAALATGIAATSHGFVALLDGDDEWAPEHLTQIIALADGPGATAVFSTTERFDATLMNWLGFDPPEKVSSAYRRSPPTLTDVRSGVVPWLPPTSGIAADGPLLRQLATEIPRSLRIAADGWLQIALAMRADRLAWNLDSTVILRLHGNNAWTGRDEFDPNVLTARRTLYAQLADAVVALDASRPRVAEGLERTLRAQSQEFAIWEHIVRGDAAAARALVREWSPPLFLRGRHRTFRLAHTRLATVIPLGVYRGLRSAWRSLFA